MLSVQKFEKWGKLDSLLLHDSHSYWKTVKPLFLDKVQVNSSVTLLENGKMVSKDSEIAEIFNNYFANITESLGISANESLLVPTNDIVDPIDKAVMKFQSHPSIRKIKENTTSSIKFDFREVAPEDVAVQIKKTQFE